MGKLSKNTETLQHIELKTHYGAASVFKKTGVKMNFFFLDQDPKKCAEYHNDCHAFKMCSEYTQMLSNAFPDGTGPKGQDYHHNRHPTAIWVCESLENYEYLMEVTRHLMVQYSMRYKKRHHNYPAFKRICEVYKRSGIVFPKTGFTPIPLVVNEAQKDIPCTVTAYRTYYIQNKSHLAKWFKIENTPKWFYNSVDANFFSDQIKNIMALKTRKPNHWKHIGYLLEILESKNYDTSEFSELLPKVHKHRTTEI